MLLQTAVQIHPRNEPTLLDRSSSPDRGQSMPIRGCFWPRPVLPAHRYGSFVGALRSAEAKKRRADDPADDAQRDGLQRTRADQVASAVARLYTVGGTATAFLPKPTRCGETSAHGSPVGRPSSLIGSQRSGSATKPLAPYRPACAPSSRTSKPWTRAAPRRSCRRSSQPRTSPATAGSNWSFEDGN